MANSFLKAEWKKLAMANYAIDPNLLKPHVPYKTEIDWWNNTCYVSLVGFMFLNTTVKGFRIPFHINFEEVNLRFYVKHKVGNEWKRGVVFIKEIVPRPAITLVANTLYNEKYQTMPMHHTWASKDELLVEYQWKKRKWNLFRVNADPASTAIENGSEEEFITEHYWGYTKCNDQKTSEYEVKHPRWEVYKTKSFLIDVDFEGVYGEEFGFLSKETPRSVFLAEGSEIQVNQGMILR